MTEAIEIQTLYTSIAKSLEEANRALERDFENSDSSYAITELDMGIAYDEISVDQNQKIKITLPKEGSVPSEAKSLKFKVRFVPKTSTQTAQQEDNVQTEKSSIVPNLVGSTLEQASKLLGVANLKIGDIAYDARNREKGIIIKQKPEADTRLKEGQPVDLIIGGAAPARDVPNSGPTPTRTIPKPTTVKKPK